MNIVVIISLSISLFFVSLAAFILFAKNQNLNGQISDKSSKIIDLNLTVSSLSNKINEFQITEKKNYAFLPGNKALLYDYGLSKGTEGFKVNYEVEILEVTPTKLKVKAIDFTSDDKIGKDPSLKTAIIDFLDGKWVNKSSAQIILDESHIRELKLNQIL